MIDNVIELSRNGNLTDLERLLDENNALLNASNTVSKTPIGY